MLKEVYMYIKESLQGIYNYLSVTSVASSFVVTFVALINMFFTILNKVIDKKINKRYN